MTDQTVEQLFEKYVAKLKKVLYITERLCYNLLCAGIACKQKDLSTIYIKKKKDKEKTEYE